MIEIKLSQLEERILELRSAVEKRVALVAEMEVFVVLTMVINVMCVLM